MYKHVSDLSLICNKNTFNNKLTENIVSEKLYDKRGRGAAMLSTPKSLKTIN